jgi:5-methylcytosine-specific restriction endonuclease McrA
VNKVKSSIIVSRRYLANNRVLTFPKMSNLKQIKVKVKAIIKNSQNLTATELVMKLNPIIKGGSNYLCLGQSINILYNLDKFIFNRIRAWLIKKFHKTSRKMWYRDYFGTGLDPKAKKEEYSPQRWANLSNQGNFIAKLPLGLKWYFSGTIINSKLRLKTTWLSMASKKDYIIPPQLVVLSNKCKPLNPYSNTEEYTEHALITRKQRKEVPTPNSKKWTLDNNSILYNQQEGRYEFCNLYLHDLEDYEGGLDMKNTAIHHVIPLSNGGCSNLKNLLLIHEACHLTLHREVGRSGLYNLKFCKENKKM